LATTDVLIIGSGAGGAPLALRLSQVGFNVTVLEKGPRYERSDYQHDEMLRANDLGFFVPPPSEEPHVLVNHAAAEPELTTLGWIACCVGGGTAHMGGSMYRFHPDDFRLLGRLGPFESISDWPYTYADLEPYYSQAEWEIGVSGEGAANPFEGLRSRPYPMPPLKCHPLARHLDQACTRLGVRAFPTPRAINSRRYGGRPKCAACDFCAGYGCPIGARGSTQEALLPRAEATGKCKISTRAMVHTITVDRSGRVTGCRYLDQSGAQHEVRAKVVCVCCSAIESARLLLLSQSAVFPDGLANGSGLVGQNLQFHTVSTGRGRFRFDRHPRKGLQVANPFLGRSVMDYYFLPGGVSSLPKGGLLRFDLSRTTPIAMAQRVASQDPTGPMWGDRLKKCLWEHFREYREVEFEVFQDFVPNERTFVELDPCIRDKWGLAVARIHLGQVDHHKLAGQWLVGRGLDLLAAVGADELLTETVGKTTGLMTHGTCRAGENPTQAVLNGFCQAHEVPNLFVVDGSFMPTSGGAPSTLTIIANSFRTADYIRDRARTGEFG